MENITSDTQSEEDKTVRTQVINRSMGASASLAFWGLCTLIVLMGGDHPELMGLVWAVLLTYPINVLAVSTISWLLYRYKKYDLAKYISVLTVIHLPLMMIMVTIATKSN